MQPPRPLKDVLRRGMILFGVAILLIVGGKAHTATEIAPGASIEVDEPILQAVLETFHQADEAVRAGNLEKIMALYSEHYDFHGLKKTDIRKVWADLFDEFREISNVHHLTRFTKVGSGSQVIVEVTCTGKLSGRSKTSGLTVPVDSWSEEIHYLKFEDGRWRIRGNVGESPRMMPFGTAPHPLF